VQESSESAQHARVNIYIYIYIYIYRTDKEGTLKTAIETDTLTRSGVTEATSKCAYSALPENGPVHEERRPRWTATGWAYTVARTSTCTPTSLPRSVSVPASDFVTAAQCLEQGRLSIHEEGNSGHEREGGAVQQGDSGVDEVRPRKQRAGDRDDGYHPC
jgi:hypothetical protein